MKKIRVVICLLLTVVLTCSLAAPVMAASNNIKTVKVKSIKSSWTASTEMVNWSGSDWAKEWVNWMLADAGVSYGTDLQKARALYDATIKYADYNNSKLNEWVLYDGRWTQIRDIRSSSLSSYVEHYTFMQCMEQVAVYASDPRTTTPKWLAGDYARFLTGMLRIAGIPAYIEVGYVASEDDYLFRVIMIDGATNWSYYLDPCSADRYNDSDGFFQMTKLNYDYDYKFSKIYDEKAEAKKPPATEPTKPKPDPKPTTPTPTPTRPTTPEVSAKSKSVGNVSASWLASSKMVNWKSADWSEWVTWLLKNEDAYYGTDLQKARALYDATIKYGNWDDDYLDRDVWYNGKWTSLRDVPAKKVETYVPQYTFTQCMEQLADAVLYDGTLPSWRCGDYARFLTGLLRAADIPAYIEVGYQKSLDHYHYRVVMIDKAKMQKYWLDPCMADETGDYDDYFKMTETLYANDYVYKWTDDEKASSVVLAAAGSKSTGSAGGDTNTTTTTQKITIAKNKRYNNGEFDLSFVIDGKTISNDMAVVSYDGKLWFPARDLAHILRKYTVRPLSLNWSKTYDTLSFGDTERNRNEAITWTSTVNKTAQAYLVPKAWYGGYQTEVRVIVIDGLAFVNAEELMEEVGLIVK